MFAQTGRPDRAFRLWAPLLDRCAARTSPGWRRSGPRSRRCRRGGRSIALPAAAPAGDQGPTCGRRGAAAEMTPEDRQAMIEGMVGQLRDRLATEGGPAEDWARLIGALACWAGPTGRRRSGRGAGALRRERPRSWRRSGRRRSGPGWPSDLLRRSRPLPPPCPSGGAIAGLDLGDKTIGVAVSDLRRQVATPLLTIRRVKFTVDAAALLALLQRAGDRGHRAGAAAEHGRQRGAARAGDAGLCAQPGAADRPADRLLGRAAVAPLRQKGHCWRRIRRESVAKR